MNLRPRALQKRRRRAVRESPIGVACPHLQMTRHGRTAPSAMVSAPVGTLLSRSTALRSQGELMDRSLMCSLSLSLSLSLSSRGVTNMSGLARAPPCPCLTLTPAARNLSKAWRPPRTTTGQQTPAAARARSGVLEELEGFLWLPRPSAGAVPAFPGGEPTPGRACWRS